MAGSESAMWEFVQQYEPIIRLSAFFGIFAIMAGWEVLAPRRQQQYPRRIRWTNNLGIVVFNTVVLRLVIPTTAVGLAIAAEGAGWGLLNNLPIPGWLAVIVAVIVLDFAIYLQHVLVHAVPALWRLHRMHHADLDFDVTTGARFHPFEILLSMGLKLMVIGAIGPPALAVLIFEVLLNGTAMFNHANVRLPKRLDSILRLFIVTPDMHRVHHSVVVNETNSNFGFNLPWWDRLFGTYRDQPAKGHEAMTIGIEEFRNGRELWLDRLLVQPFKGKAGEYAISRHKKSGQKPNKKTGRGDD